MISLIRRGTFNVVETELITKLKNEDETRKNQLTARRQRAM